MERYIVFTDWKNEYCYNDHITQGTLQSQSNPYQITNGIFHKTRINSKISMETQKTPNSANNFEKEE